MARNSKKTTTTDSNYLEFHIFDCFHGTKDKSMTFIESFKMLSELKSNKYIHIVETIPVDNEKEVMRYFKQFIDNGYEGAVVRIGSAKYKFGFLN
jgi:ATP-dependent DNA ligase